MRITNKSILILLLITILISIAGTWLSLSKLQTITGKITLSTQDTAPQLKNTAAQNPVNCETCLQVCLPQAENS